MATKFKDLVAAVEEEARAEGAEAVAELATLRMHFSLAHQLIALRRRHKLTQKELAALTGIGQSEISKIERGVSNPTIETLSVLGAPFNAKPMLVDEDLHVIGGPEETGVATREAVPA